MVDCMCFLIMFSVCTAQSDPWCENKGSICLKHYEQYHDEYIQSYAKNTIHHTIRPMRKKHVLEQTVMADWLIDSMGLGRCLPTFPDSWHMFVSSAGIHRQAGRQWEKQTLLALTQAYHISHNSTYLQSGIQFHTETLYCLFEWLFICRLLLLKLKSSLWKKINCKNHSYNYNFLSCAHAAFSSKC